MVPQKKEIHLHSGKYGQAHIKNPEWQKIKKTQEGRKTGHVLLDSGKSASG
jgi:hypothetical protein